MNKERLSARARHPSSRWKAETGRLQAQLADRFREERHPWPDAAAMLLAARGRLGLERQDFADALGIDIGVIIGLEDGTAAPADVARWTRGKLQPEDG